MPNTKQLRYLIVGAICLVLAGLLLTLAIKLPEEQKTETSQETPQTARVPDKQEEFLARIQQGDRVAFEEFKQWMVKYEFSFWEGKPLEYKLDGGSIWFFPKDRNQANSKNILVVEKGKELLPVDLGRDAIQALAVKDDGTFFYRKNVFDVGPGSLNGCGRDQSVFSVDISGSITKHITDTICERDGEYRLTFHARNKDEQDISFIVNETDHGYRLVSSNASVEVPRDLTYGQPGLSADVLIPFLLEGNQNELHFFVRDTYLGESTTTLYLRPKPRVDEKSAAINNCRSAWEWATEGVKTGNDEALVSFEKCAVVLNYPFKKFSIPGSTSYYGFLGNYGSKWASREAKSDGVWCQMDGLPNGCLLYKAENGIPRVVEAGELRQKELLKARADGSILVYQFPYEIFYYLDYEWYDFVNNTTTAGVVNYHGETDYDGEYSPSTLSFYPNGRKIELVVALEGQEGKPLTVLKYGGRSIGGFYDREGKDEFQYGTFPKPSDLGAYAIQNDKTKFYFTAEDRKYTLDLTPEIPRIIER